MLYFPSTLPLSLNHAIIHENAGLVTKELNKDPRLTQILTEFLNHSRNRSNPDFINRLNTCRYMNNTIKNSKLSFQNFLLKAHQTVQSNFSILTIFTAGKNPEKARNTHDNIEISQEHKNIANVFIEAIIANDMSIIMTLLNQSLKNEDEIFFKLLPDMLSMLSKEQFNDLFDFDIYTNANVIETMLIAYPCSLELYEVILKSLKKLVDLNDEVISRRIEELLKQKVLFSDPHDLSPLQRFLKLGRVVN